VFPHLLHAAKRARLGGVHADAEARCDLHEAPALHVMHQQRLTLVRRHAFQRAMHRVGLHDRPETVVRDVVGADIGRERILEPQPPACATPVHQAHGVIKTSTA
jgi:hypothetical protein